MIKINNVVLDADFDPTPPPPEAQAEFDISGLSYSVDEGDTVSIGVTRSVRTDQTLLCDWDIINATVTPFQGTLTFNPGDVEKTVLITGGSVESTEQGLLQISNPRKQPPIINDKGNPILGDRITVPFDVVDLSSPQVKRWNPHHGHRIQGDAADGDQASYWGKVANGMNATAPVNDHPELEGVLFAVAWGSVERDGGDPSTWYWTDLDNAMNTAQSNGIRVNLQATFKNFRTNYTYIGPSDLSADVLNNVNSNGTPVNTMAMHRTHVMSRYITFLKEILNRYESYSMFEILSSAELLLSFGTGGSPADYTNAILAAENKRMHQEMGVVVTPVNFMPNINHLSGETPELIESLWDNRLGHGTPDMRETSGDTLFINGVADGGGPIGDYRGQLAKQSIVSVQDWGFGAFNTVDEILQPGGEIDRFGMTHLYWADQDSGPFVWQDLLDGLNTYPGRLDGIGCPTRWLGCATNP